MPTFTPNKNLVVPNHNEFVNTWDTAAANPDYTTIDTCFSGTLSLNATGLSGTVALTQTNVQPPSIQISGAPTAAITYTVPTAIGGVWIVRNTTTGGFTVGIASAAGGSTVTIPAGTQLQVWCDGTATGMLLSNTAPALTGVVLPYAGSTAPGWALLCFGQAVSRTIYAALFTAIGTTYGAGDGSTTFNLPDLRGRDVAGKDDMGGAAAGRLTNATMTPNGTTLGATGGTQTNTTAVSGGLGGGAGSAVTAGGWSGSAPAAAGGDFNALTTTSLSSINMTNIPSSAFAVVQPTLILNYIIGI